MGIIWQGILLGLGLSVLVGPMLFLYLQIGINKGFKSAFFLGLGSWISDLMFIVGAYFGISYAMTINEDGNIKLWMGMIGGIILIVIGIGLLIQKPKATSDENSVPQKNTTLKGYWLRGFLINTFNPFALFFWISVMTGFTGGNQNSPREAVLLFGSIIGTIIFTDILKIMLAKQLKKLLSNQLMQLSHKIVGTALVVFGIVLVFRVI